MFHNISKTVYHDMKNYTVMAYSRTTNPENTERDGSVHAIAISTFIVFLCVPFVILMIWMKRRKSIAQGKFL